jgi:hypothetical protein
MTFVCNRNAIFAMEFNKLIKLQTLKQTNKQQTNPQVRAHNSGKQSFLGITLFSSYSLILFTSVSSLINVVLYYLYL